MSMSHTILQPLFPSAKRVCVCMARLFACTHINCCTISCNGAPRGSARLLVRRLTRFAPHGWEADCLSTRHLAQRPQTQKPHILGHDMRRMNTHYTISLSSDTCTAEPAGATARRVTFIHLYIHTFVHSYIRTNKRTVIHSYIQECCQRDWLNICSIRHRNP